MMRFVIPIAPVTKKNHQQIRRTKDGRCFIAQSEQYRQYAKDCRQVITGAYRKKINVPVNVKALYYMPTRRRVDIVNLHSALHDVLVEVGVLEDDNSQIVVSTDGSRVFYDKHNPRTEVEIERREDEQGSDESRFN